MIFKRELSILFLLSMLGGCVSQEEACIQEIEDRGDGDICGLMLIYYGDLGSPIDSRRREAEANIDAATIMCVNYLMKIEQCKKKSKTVPAINL